MAAFLKFTSEGRPRCIPPRTTLIVSLLLAGGCATGLATAGLPEVLDPRYVIELVTGITDVVTPVGCTHDHLGRLLVIESHTHQRPEGYSGPPHDRIRLVEDTDGDGLADRFQTFHEGTRFTMAIRGGADNWIYVATRAEVFRLRDTDGDDVADEREQLLRLDTAGDYPHNGLGGLAFAADGSLRVGLGENLGVAYTLVAADGSSWTGEGEGGSVFRCSPTGAMLSRVATGFWNPFGLSFDPAGRLFAVDNDPDACPPCRLINVVPTGDYGYRFRYGRSGRHPLQCWDGELAGTLPMAAGTGEAPCNVVPYDGGLWVTSWGHNRLEVFVPEPQGAACLARSRIVVQGDHDFRPVDASPAPDGSLLVTDWVDRSYPVHGRGRIWRLRPARGKYRVGAADWPPLSTDEQRAQRLAFTADTSQAERLVALGDPDPFIRQAAVAGILTADVPLPAWEQIDNQEKLGVLMARRWQDDVANHGSLPGSERSQPVAGAHLRDALLADALADADERVVSFAVRWIADERITELRPSLERLLTSDTTPTLLVSTLLAAIDWLEQNSAASGKYDRAAMQQRLQAIWQDAMRSPRLRLAALQMTTEIPKGEPLHAVAAIASSPAGGDESLAREAVRLLAVNPTENAVMTLEAILGNTKLPAARRADALVGLARLTNGESRLAAFIADPSPELAAAARDLLSGATASSTNNGLRPSAVDTTAWIARLGAGGDPEVGWRVFFGSRRSRCSECHAVGGRGAAVGPELTGIARRMGRGRVLESILQPARQVGPAFQPYAVTLTDGRVVSGISLATNGRDRTERFLTTDGSEVTVLMTDIEHRTPLATSIMPAGLEQGLSDDDLRNLLALLEQ